MSRIKKIDNKGNRKSKKMDRKSRIRKIGKNVVLSTLTATMLVSAFPFHQSSTTVGRVMAAENATVSENTSNSEVKINNLNSYIDSSITLVKKKIKEILVSNNIYTESKEKEIFSKIDSIAEDTKAKLASENSEAEPKENIMNEYEKKINEVLDSIHPEKTEENQSNEETSKMNVQPIVALPSVMSLTIPRGEEVDKKAPGADAKLEAVDQKKLALEKLKAQKAMVEKMKAEAIAKALANKKRIRVGGKNRRETALGVSRMKFNASDKIILVNENSFSDALTASVLAEAMDVPILLTNGNDISPEVLFEMQRLKAKDVLILGGESSVSPVVEAKLKALKANVERIAGKDRYETSAIIADKIYSIGGNNRSAIVVSGENYPDAISIAPVAARELKPILLVKKDEMSRAVSDVLMYDSIKNITIVGGENSVSKKIEGRFLRWDVTRIAGQDRYDTSEKIAEQNFKDSKSIFIATGEDFADALVAGPAAATTNSPILLVNKKGFTKGIKTYIDKSKAFALIFLGGENSVPKEFEDKLAMIGDEKSRAEAAKKAEEAKKLEESKKAEALKKAEDLKKAGEAKKADDSKNDSKAKGNLNKLKAASVSAQPQAIKAVNSEAEPKDTLKNSTAEKTGTSASETVSQGNSTSQSETPETASTAAVK